MKAKQYYFEAKTYRPVNYPETPSDSLVRMTVRKLNEALSYDTLAAYIYVDLAVINFYKLIDHESSIKFVMKAIELCPNWVYANYIAGNSFRGTDHSKAIYYLKKAIDLNADFGKAYYNLGVIHNALGRHQQAIEYLKKAIEINPDHVDAYRVIAYAFYYIGQTEKSLIFTQKAAQLQPDYAQAHNDVGLAHKFLGNFEEAIRHFKAVRKISILPYNTAAGAAYRLIGREYSLEGLEYSNEKEQEILQIFAPTGIKTEIGR